MGFVLAMTRFPEVQKRAQEEIDRVIGGDHLPDVSDRERLPYCAALCKELLRFVNIFAGDVVLKCLIIISQMACYNASRSAPFQ